MEISRGMHSIDCKNGARFYIKKSTIKPQHNFGADKYKEQIIWNFHLMAEGLFL